MNELLSAALRYGEMGWLVFPLHTAEPDGTCSCHKGRHCNRPAKHPRTPHGVDDASSDAQRIQGWWRRWPDANIGLAAGQGMATILDIDGDKGKVSIEEMATGLMPSTPQVRTANGLHIYFQFVPDARNRVRLAPGLDIRTSGGYVVAPPSVHHTGVLYEWLHPPNTPLAPMPDWLRSRINRPKERAAQTAKVLQMPQRLSNYVQSALERECRTVRQAGQGARNITLNTAAYNLGQLVGGGHLSHELAASHLEHAANEAGLGSDEARRTIGSGIRSGIQNPRNPSLAFTGQAQVMTKPAPEPPPPPPPPSIDQRIDALEHSLAGEVLSEALAPILADIAKLSPLARDKHLEHIKERWGVNALALRRELKAAAATRSNPVCGDWRDQLLRYPPKDGEFGALKANAANVITILQCDPAWKGVVGFDAFGVRTVKLKRPPWDDLDAADGQESGEEWNDCDDTRLVSWLSRRYGIDYRGAIGAAVEVAARTRSFHPVREYLLGLQWDGKERLDDAPARFWGTSNSPYHRAVFRWWMISAIARVFEPGCKADYVLILEGEQGLRKSSSLLELARPWFSDTSFEIGSKDAFMALRGQWIVELAELDALSRADESRAKSFFSSRTDNFRPPYGRRVVEQPRGCVFAGSTNENQYLRDPTGARRYWPIKCKLLDIEAIRGARDQLWAEARTRFERGERWWPETPEEHAMCADAQDERRTSDAWDSLIEEWVCTRVNDTFTMAEVMSGALNMEPSKMTRSDQTRVGNVLRRMGCTRSRPRNNAPGGRTFVYKRPPEIARSSELPF
jgi:predicted P-loop ATPase